MLEGVDGYDLVGEGIGAGLFGAPGWIQVQFGSGFGLLIGGLEWI